MTAFGTLYGIHRQGAADYRLAAGLAAAGGHTATAHRYAEAAEYHDRRADQVRSELLAARKIGMGGSAGVLPKDYMSDAPTLPATPQS